MEGTMATKRASVFWNGGSQAVRLPKEFRFESNSVEIEQHGNVLILKPAEKEWSDEFWACLGLLSSDVKRQKAKKQNREQLFE
jgi:virulence-associated protein VagC